MRRSTFIVPSIARRCKRAPWYREPWPWILISGPAIVVVAGMATP